jgi:hypothetical protein
MKYRLLGKTGEKVSVVGFGALRLPHKGNVADVDEALGIESIRFAIDHGVNYIDTGYVYQGGNSERVVGRALANGYREKVYVATKLPIWMVQNLKDCDSIFEEQLVRLQADHIDFYLLHGLQKKFWQRACDLGVLRWAERLRAKGRIKHFGFSFHDSYEVLVEILGSYDWTYCQIQYNYVNEEVQAGTKGLKYAAKQGLGVIIMQPLFGGLLASPPQPIEEIWSNSHYKHRPADVALRWLWDKPQISMVLNGMSALEQVKENIDSACRSGVGSLSAKEAALVARLQEEYKKLSPIPCTKCGYCMPCPNGVNIPDNFQLYNRAAAVSSSGLFVVCRCLYNSLPKGQRASGCQECGICEEKCPQQIPIGQRMQQVQRQFK